MNNLYRVLLLLTLLMLSNVIATAQMGSPDTSFEEKQIVKNAESFSEGLENKYNQNYTAAIKCFEKALEYYPDDDASMYELSELYALMGRNSEAFAMIEKASALSPDNKWYSIRLANFYMQNGEYEKFIDIYDNLLAGDPNNLEYLEAYVDVMLKVGDYDAVIDKLNLIEKQVGVNEFITLQKVGIYQFLEDNKMVLTELEQLVKAYPYETRFMSMLAEQYLNNKKDKDALKLYLKIKELNPEDPYINVSLLEYYQNHGELVKAYQEFLAALRNKNLDYNTKANIYEYWFENKESDENDVILQAEEAGNIFVEMHPDKEIGYYILGTVYYNRGQYLDARNLYASGLERDSTSFITWYQIGYCDMELSDYDALELHADKALTYYPEQPIFYLFKGVALLNLDRREDAVKVMEKGKKLSADKALTVMFDTYIGDTYYLLEDKENAFRYYENVLRNDPENVYVMNNYAYYLSLESRDLEKALQMSGKTIKAEPKNVIYIDTYAWILYKMGRYKEAKSWMEKVFSIDKNASGTNYEHYGDILYQLGDVKKAVQNWKKAKKLGETSEFIDMKIKDEKLYE